MYTKINAEIVEVVKRSRSDGKTVKEIADLNHLSISSVYRILNGYYNYILEEKPINIINTIDTSTSPFNVFKPNKKRGIIRYGLISKRHNITTDLYVFNKSVPSWLMFDYNELDKICRHFLKNNLSFDEDGEPTTDIILYTTGLQCALASFIKICNEMHVNLTLAHYNDRYEGYEQQIIFNGFGSKSDLYPYEINYICEDADACLTYNCKASDFKYCNTLFVITITKFIKNSNEITNKKVIFCMSNNDSWNCYKELIEQLNKNEDIEIIIEQYEKSLDGYITFSKKIVSSCNF